MQEVIKCLSWRNNGAMLHGNKLSMEKFTYDRTDANYAQSTKKQSSSSSRLYLKIKFKNLKRPRVIQSGNEWLTCYQQESWVEIKIHILYTLQIKIYIYTGLSVNI